jgi:transposase
MASQRAWAGIDMGMTQSFLCVIDENGTELIAEPVATDAEHIRLLLKGLVDYEVEQIAVEAGGTGMHAIRELLEEGMPVAIYEAQRVSKYLRIRPNKTDKSDAAGLAEIARFGMPSLRKVFLKSPQFQKWRSNLAFRHKVVVQRTAFEGMLRSLIKLHGGVLTEAFKNKGFEKAVLIELDRLSNDKGVNLSEQVIPLLDLCLSLRKYQNTLTHEIERWVSNNPVCSRFTEVPGVGPLCALSFYTAIEDPFRFEKDETVGAYFGLTPKIMQSGQSLQHGRITKRGSRLTRTHLVQSAGILLRSKHPSTLQDWGIALQKRAGWGKARVAVARKLAIILLAMWKGGERYSPKDTKRICMAGDGE